MSTTLEVSRGLGLAHVGDVGKHTPDDDCSGSRNRRDGRRGDAPEPEERRTSVVGMGQHDGQEDREHEEERHGRHHAAGETSGSRGNLGEGVRPAKLGVNDCTALVSNAHATNRWSRAQCGYRDNHAIHSWKHAVSKKTPRAHAKSMFRKIDYYHRPRHCIGVCIYVLLSHVLCSLHHSNSSRDRATMC